MRAKCLTRRVVNDEGLADAVSELQRASTRGWNDLEIAALEKFLDHADLTIEIWMHPKGEGLG